jgi:hypothetical protein
MSLNALARKYISSAGHVFSHMEITQAPITLDTASVCTVVDFAKAYLKDAEFYREKEKFEVSLTSVAYCEGLLDALRLLGAVRFEWPTRKGKTKRSEE